MKGLQISYSGHPLA